MKNKRKVKKYEINSFEKLINIVNDENFEVLAVDLCNWLYKTMVTINHFKKEYPEQCKNRTNYQILESVFIWYDDGKNEYKGSIVKDKNTGQIFKL